MTTASPILLTLGQTLGPAPRGRTAAPVPLRWPNKLAAASGLYGVDASLLLAPGETIQSATVAIDPAETGGLSASTTAVSGAVATFELSAGVADHDYGVIVTLPTSAGGRILVADCGLYVAPFAYPSLQLAAPSVSGSGASPAPTISGGAGGAAVFTAIAAATISAPLAVAAQGGGVIPADAANAALAGAVVGIATTAANTGGDVTVQTSGLVTFNGWTWTPGEQVYVGAAGQLTQAAPDTGFLQCVGTADSATALVVNIEQPILL